VVKRDEIRIQVWTERFLGTPAKGVELVEMLYSIDGGRWVPDNWDHYEPVRRLFSRKSTNEVVAALTEVRGGDVSNNVNFVKKRPAATFSLTVWRSTVPSMNRMHINLDARELSGADGTSRISSLVVDLVTWSRAVFASARHTKQAHWRVAQKTPRERIQEMDWLTFFGKPYCDLFGGKERVLKAPCYSIKEVSDGLLLMASSRADSPEMTDSDQVLIGLEEYLGPDAFAGRGYPLIPCRVPTFDLSETTGNV